MQYIFCTQFSPFYFYRLINFAIITANRNFMMLGSKHFAPADKASL